MDNGQLDDTILSVHVLSCFSHVLLCGPIDCSLPGFSVHGDSLGKNPGVGCHILLQGIFLTQALNPTLVLLALAAGFFTTSATWDAHTGESKITILVAANTYTAFAF